MQVQPYRVRFDPVALQAQRKLIDTIGLVKKHLLQDKAEIIEGKNDCLGRVAEIAFFKIGIKKENRTFESSAALLEVIMWDVAVLLGMTSKFVPTCLVRLQYKEVLEEVKGKKEKKQHFKIDGINTGNGVIASLQPKQIGRALEASDDVVPREEYAAQLVYSLVLGQYDQHSDNVLLYNLELFNFDNSLAFPPENGFINLWDKYLYSSIRPSMLGMKNGRHILSHHDRELCLSHLRSCKAKLSDVQTYFSSYSIKKRLAKLPPGQLNPERSIRAAYSRIEKLEEAFSKTSLKTYRDVVLGAFQDYRLSIALLIICYSGLTQDKVFEYGSEIEDNLKKISNSKLPFKKIKEIVDGFTTYEVFFTELRKVAPVGSESNEALIFLENIKAKVTPECKTLSRKRSKETIRNSLISKFESWGLFLNGFGNRVVLFEGEPHPFDVTTIPGKIIVKAHRGELPPNYFDQLDKGIIVYQFLKLLEEENIPLKLVKERNREKTLRSMAPYSYYVEQISGAVKPRFSLVYKAADQPRIIPLENLDVGLVQLLIPPYASTLKKQVEIDDIRYEAEVNLSGVHVKVGDAELPSMTLSQFEEWKMGEKPELAILETVNQFNVKVVHEDELPLEIEKIDCYCLIQLKGKKTLQFKLAIVENSKTIVYDLEIQKTKKTSGKVKEVFVLKDKEGNAASLSYDKFYLKVNRL